MAAVLRIENYDASESMSLLGPEVSLERKSGDMVIDPLDPFVTTVYRVNLSDADRANTRAALIAVVNLLERAMKWQRDDLLADSVWLRFASDGETAKRARIAAYTFKNQAGAGVDPYQLLTHRLQVDLAITRERDPEDATAVSWSPSGGSDNLTSGYRVFRHYSGGYIPAGDRGGRIFLPLSVTLSGGSGILDKYWIGMRPERLGYSSFVPVIKFEDASGNSRPVDVDYVSKSGSYGTNVARVRFSTGGGVDSMAWRQFITLGDVMAGNYDHMVGEYQMLIRYQVDSGSQVAIRAGIAYAGNQDTAAYNGTQYDLTADGAWHFLQLGVMRLPPRGFRYLTRSTSYGTIDLSSLTFWIDAERLSGSGALYLDLIKPIPYDHYLAVSGLVAADGYYFNLITHEDGQIEAITRAGSGLLPISGYGEITEAHNWGVPDTQDFIVSFAGERLAGSNSGDVATLLTPEIWRRWGAYHGD